MGTDIQLKHLSGRGSVAEALVNFGNARAALGVAQMNASGDHPTISNIISSANAGAAAPKMWAARTAL